MVVLIKYSRVNKKLRSGRFDSMSMTNTVLFKTDFCHILFPFSALETFRQLLLGY